MAKNHSSARTGVYRSSAAGLDGGRFSAAADHRPTAGLLFDEHVERAGDFCRDRLGKTGATMAGRRRGTCRCDGNRRRRNGALVPSTQSERDGSRQQLDDVARVTNVASVSIGNLAPNVSCYRRFSNCGVGHCALPGGKKSATTLPERPGRGNGPGWTFVGGWHGSHGATIFTRGSSSFFGKPADRQR